MQMFPVTSSRITHMGYEESTATVYVRFPNGTRWKYMGVPASVWEQFRRAPSKGQFINDVLNNYQYSQA